MATRVEIDLRRAKELRAMEKGVKDPDAVRGLEEAARRLERNAVRKLRKVGRPLRLKPRTARNPIVG